MDEVILRPLHHHHLQKKHRRRFPCTFAKHQEWIWQGIGGRTMEKQMLMKPHDMSLGGGFKYFVFSPLPGQMIQFDYYFSVAILAQAVSLSTKRSAQSKIVDSRGFSEYLEKADVLGAEAASSSGSMVGRNQLLQRCLDRVNMKTSSPEAEAQVFPNTPSSFGFEERWQAFQAPHLRGEQAGEILLAKAWAVRFRFSTGLCTSQQCVNGVNAGGTRASRCRGWLDLKCLGRLGQLLIHSENSWDEYPEESW